ncbi:hypothetical protein IE53DRAFT_384781 [Violaceomyces palustris]|uniref:Uncharacterized protein n=1 Tax=Violaceomyces palustris TaxID=1673888 RepID=A0ACD0P435_9BASI|nr:hypothetical protein IE53DRAFT_384781 [Violaceomyces palustris]
MSFLPSLSNYTSQLSLALPSSSSSSSSSNYIASSYRPASLNYLTIFSPSLRPTNAGSEDSSADSQMILFYTCRERAVSLERMLRQVGIARGTIEFARMVTSSNSSRIESSNSTSRACTASLLGKGTKCWNVHSSKRRMVLVEVEDGIFINASIDLPSTLKPGSESAARTSTKVKPPDQAEDVRASTKEPRNYFDSWLSDEWVEQSMHLAWRDWRLLNGPPSKFLCSDNGRRDLEKSLEKYFSVWAWSWDLDGPDAEPSPACDSAVVSVPKDGKPIVGQTSNLLSETSDGIPIVFKAPRSKLARLLDEFEQSNLEGIERGEGVRKGRADQTLRERCSAIQLHDMVLLSDTSILWPPSNAGCFEQGGSPPSLPLSASGLDPSQRRDIVRHVLAHLTGLEKERALVRAATGSGSAERRRPKGGTSHRKGFGAESGVNLSKRKGRSMNATALGSPASLRTDLVKARSKGLGNDNAKRSASGPALPSGGSSSPSSSPISTVGESGKWTGWGGMLSSLSRGLSLRGTPSGSGSNTPAVPVANHSRSHSPARPEHDSISSAGGKGTHSDDTGVTEIEEPCQRMPAKMEAAPDAADSSSGAAEGDQVEGLSIGRTVCVGDEEAWNNFGTTLSLVGRQSPSMPPKQPPCLEPPKAVPSGQICGEDPPSEFLVATEISQEHQHQAPREEASGQRRDSHTDPSVDLMQLAEALDDVTGAKTESNLDHIAWETNTDGEGTLVHDRPSSRVSEDSIPNADLASKPSSGDSAPKPQEGDVEADRCSLVSTATSSGTKELKAFPSISITSAAWYTSKIAKEKGFRPDDGDKGTVLSGMGSSDSEQSQDGVAYNAYNDQRVSVAGTASTDPVRSMGAGGKASSSTDILRERVHHDFELDGWGDEEPLPFKSIKCFLLCKEESTTVPENEQGRDQILELEVLYTTRRLLTLILVISTSEISKMRTKGKNRGISTSSLTNGDLWVCQEESDRSLNSAETSSVKEKGPPCPNGDGEKNQSFEEKILKPSWELLRRIQRVLNDHLRTTNEKRER